MSLVKSLSKGLAAHIRRIPATTTPQMQKIMTLHGPMFQKTVPEFPRFKEVLKTMKPQDFKVSGLVVNEEAQAALGEFYLAIALRLHPEKIEAVIEDNNALLKLAFETAENDFEPWIQEAREFLSTYDEDVHDELKMLEIQMADKKFCEGTYWTKFFEKVAPENYEKIRTLALSKEAELNSHDAVDAFLAKEQVIQADIEATRIATADSVLNDFKKDMRRALVDNGLYLVSTELKSAMEAQKKELMN